MFFLLFLLLPFLDATNFEIHGTLICKFRLHPKYRYSIWIYDRDTFSGPDHLLSPIEDHGELSENVTRVWTGHLDGDEVSSSTYTLQAKVWHDCERYYYKEYKLFYIDFEGRQCEKHVELCIIHFELDISDLERAKVVSVVPTKVVRIFHVPN